MKKALVALLALAALMLPAAAPRTRSATSRSTATARSCSRGERIYVRYALDLAEIPAFQEGAKPYALPSFADTVAAELVLELDGRRVPLVPLEHEVRAAPGAGGLETLRFDAVFAAPESARGRSSSSGT